MNPFFIGCQLQLSVQSYLFVFVTAYGSAALIWKGCSLFPGVAARETAQALRTLAQAARGVAASTKEPQAAAAMLDSAQYVMEGSAMLIHEAHQALVHPGDAESQQRLAQVAHIPEAVIFVSHCSSRPTFPSLC